MEKRKKNGEGGREAMALRQDRSPLGWVVHSIWNDWAKDGCVRVITITPIYSCGASYQVWGSPLLSYSLSPSKYISLQVTSSVTMEMLNGPSWCLLTICYSLYWITICLFVTISCLFMSQAKGQGRFQSWNGYKVSPATVHLPTASFVSSSGLWLVCWKNSY